jgi:hypothetical protein
LSSLAMNIRSDPLPPEARPVMAQVGWLGQTGTVYQLHPAGRINEPGGYAPIYIQIGTWIEQEPDVWVIDD